MTKSARRQTIVEPERVRPSLVLIAPAGVVFIIVLALGQAGYEMSDYIHLIAAGKLSLFKQLVMWLALVVFTFIYCPAAFRALRTNSYVSAEDGVLVMPCGRAVAIHDIKKISFKSGLFHKLMVIEWNGRKRSFVITYASGGIGAVKQRILSDPTFEGIAVDG